MVTRNNSLDTSARILFVLLKNVFTNTRPHRVHQKDLLPKSAVNYLGYSKLNKTKKIMSGNAGDEKNLHPGDRKKKLSISLNFTLKVNFKVYT